MTPARPGWVQRLGAAAVLGAVVALAYAIVIGPALDGYAADRAAIAEQRLLLQRYEALGRQVPGLTAQLAALQRSQAAGGGFLPGGSDSLVGAQLHDRLKSLVEAEKGELQSTQMLPARDDGKFRRVSLRAQLTLGTAGLQRVIYAIEAGSPSLFLDNLDIKPHPGGGSPGGAADALDVSFDLYGYLSGVTAPGK